MIQLADTVDRESVTHYWLTVYATDLGTVPLVAWTEVYIEVLDINDNPPELSQPIYFASIQENLSKDKFLLKVAATDVDSSSEGKIMFQIPDSQRTYFNINSKTGTGWSKGFSFLLMIYPKWLNYPFSKSIVIQLQWWVMQKLGFCFETVYLIRCDKNYLSRKITCSILTVQKQVQAQARCNQGVLKEENWLNNK